MLQFNLASTLLVLAVVDLLAKLHHGEHDHRGVASREHKREPVGVVPTKDRFDKHFVCLSAALLAVSKPFYAWTPNSRYFV